jgi:hypothetical protein
MGEMSKLKRILGAAYRTFVFLVVVVLTGFVGNILLFLFHALILGWRDTAPEWYINIHNWLFYGIFIASAFFWVVTGYYRRAKNRKTPRKMGQSLLFHLSFIFINR